MTRIVRPLGTLSNALLVQKVSSKIVHFFSCAPAPPAAAARCPFVVQHAAPHFGMRMKSFGLPTFACIL